MFRNLLETLKRIISGQSSQSLTSRKNEWVIVAETTNPVEIEIMAGLLRTENIPHYVQREGAGRAMGISIGLLGRILLLVPADHAEVAIALLDEAHLDDFHPLIEEPAINFPDSEQRNQQQIPDDDEE